MKDIDKYSKAEWSNIIMMLEFDVWYWQVT